MDTKFTDVLMDTSITSSNIVFILLSIVIITTILLIPIILFVIFLFHESPITAIYSYSAVQLGMTENEMLQIMGKGYSKSLLKNNKVKYEWRINGSSHGYSRYHGNGFTSSTRYYSGVKKVDIYVKDGLVEEVKPFNC